MTSLLKLALLALPLMLMGDEPVLLKPLVSKADFITTDRLGNLYVVRLDEVTKYDRTGKELYQFSDKSLGEISSIDANNALKLVVFYRDLTQIAILDNTLSIHGKAQSLMDKNFGQVTHVCRAQREKIWLYDQEKLELVQTDINLNILTSTGNLNQLLNIDLNPTYMTEFGNQLFVGNKGHGILVFDNFGTFLKTIHVEPTGPFQVAHNAIFYVKDKQWLRYDRLSFEEVEVKIPSSDFKAVRIEESRMYIQKMDSVNIYSRK